LKVNVIATTIMEVTRKQDSKQKQLIKQFCDRLLFHKK